MDMPHQPATGSAASYAHVADAEDGEPTLLYSGEPVGGVVAVDIGSLCTVLAARYRLFGGVHRRGLVGAILYAPFHPDPHGARRQRRDFGGGGAAGVVVAKADWWRRYGIHPSHPAHFAMDGLEHRGGGPRIAACLGDAGRLRHRTRRGVHVYRLALGAGAVFQVGPCTFTSSASAVPSWAA